jgi:hypothetical protein
VFALPKTTKRIKSLLVMFYVLRRDARTKPDSSRRKENDEHSKKTELGKTKNGCGEKQNGESGRRRSRHGKKRKKLLTRSDDSANTLRRS